MGFGSTPHIPANGQNGKIAVDVFSAMNEGI